MTLKDNCVDNFIIYIYLIQKYIHKNYAHLQSFKLNELNGLGPGHRKNNSPARGDLRQGGDVARSDTPRRHIRPAPASRVRTEEGGGSQAGHHPHCQQELQKLRWGNCTRSFSPEVSGFKIILHSSF